MIDTYEIVLKFPFKVISKDNEKVFNRQGRPFTSAKYKNFERTIEQLASMQYKGKSLDGDIEMVIEAYFNTGTRCDCFNIPKGIADALQGICYHNDKQIVCGKVFVLKADENSFTVFIKRLAMPFNGAQPSHLATKTVTSTLTMGEVEKGLGDSVTKEKWNENVEECSGCGIKWKKIGKHCPVCYAPAEKKVDTGLSTPQRREL